MDDATELSKKESAVVAKLYQYLAQHDVNSPDLLAWLHWNSEKHTEESTDAVRLYRHLMSISTEEWWTTSMALLVIAGEKVGIARFGDNLPMGDGEAVAVLELKMAVLTDASRPSLDWHAVDQITVDLADEKIAFSKPINLQDVTASGQATGNDVTTKLVARTINKTLDLPDPGDLLDAINSGEDFDAGYLQHLGTAKGYLTEVMARFKHYPSNAQARTVRRIADLRATEFDREMSKWTKESAAESPRSSKGSFALTLIAGFICVSSIGYATYVDSSGWTTFITVASFIVWLIAFVACRMTRVGMWYYFVQKDREAVHQRKAQWQDDGAADRYKRQGRITRWVTFAAIVLLGYFYVGKGPYHHMDLATADTVSEIVARQNASDTSVPAPAFPGYIESVPDARWHHLQKMRIAADGRNAGLFSRSTRRGRTDDYSRLAVFSHSTYGDFESPFIKAMIDLYVKPILHKRGYDFVTDTVDGDSIKNTYKVGPFVHRDRRNTVTEYRVTSDSQAGAGAATAVKSSGPLGIGILQAVVPQTWRGRSAPLRSREKKELMAGLAQQAAQAGERVPSGTAIDNYHSFDLQNGGLMVAYTMSVSAGPEYLNEMLATQLSRIRDAKNRGIVRTQVSVEKRAVSGGDIIHTELVMSGGQGLIGIYAWDHERQRVANVSITLPRSAYGNSALKSEILEFTRSLKIRVKD